MESGTIIVIAQVINGFILPFYSAILFHCINDPLIMLDSPQGPFSNILLLACVIVTQFLPFFALISFITKASQQLRLLLALGCCLLTTALLLSFTSLWRQVVASVCATPGSLVASLRKLVAYLRSRPSATMASLTELWASLLTPRASLRRYWASLDQ